MIITKSTLPNEITLSLGVLYRINGINLYDERRFQNKQDPCTFGFTQTALPHLAPLFHTAEAQSFPSVKKIETCPK